MPTVVSYEQSGLRMAAARVKNWISGYQRPGPLVTGSGTLTAIDGDGALVLTSAHLFEGKVGPITVEFTDGQMSGARILAIDQKVDIAALWIFAPKRIEPVPLAQHDPASVEQVEIWGYGPKRFRSFLAEVAIPLPQQEDERRWLLAAQGVQDKQVTIPGDSGGPMIRQGAGRRPLGIHQHRRRHAPLRAGRRLRQGARLAPDAAIARPLAPLHRRLGELSPPVTKLRQIAASSSRGVCSRTRNPLHRARRTITIAVSRRTFVAI